MSIIKSFTPTPSDINREWFLIDAEGQTLGRLSSKIAHILRGKHKPTFATHMDVGDFIIVINAGKIHTAAGRPDSKIYYRHSKYPGSVVATTLRDQLIRHPERPIEHAVKGMLPKNALGRAMFKKLKVYAGDVHPHEAQKPQKLEL